MNPITQARDLILAKYPDLDPQRADEAAKILAASVMQTRLSGHINWADVDKATAEARQIIEGDTRCT